MPQPIDVGSVLGGRYKVLGHVLNSAENDVILEGIDQVLNRPVSILVADPGNSPSLAQSAREVATGERSAHVSILDLGTVGERTYLIASRTAPADLLDLVVPTEPLDNDGYDDVPYQEPFFTDTLGTEIFGAPRDATSAGAPYVYDDDSPVESESASSTAEEQPEKVESQPVPPLVHTPTAAVPQAASSAVGPSAPTEPAGEPAAKPKVTVWSEEDYSDDDVAAGAAVEADDGNGSYDDNDLHADDLSAGDDENAPRTGAKWLAGGVAAILVIAALVFALSNISSLFGGGNAANAPAPNVTQSQQASGSGSASAPATSAAPAAVPPQIKTITRYTPGDPSVSSQFDGRLKDAFDGNPGTYWPTLEFSNDDFAGMTDSINLVIELAQPTVINSVTIHQIASSGGQFNILTNSTPTLDGATKVGSGSFSAPDITVKTTPTAKSQYVIINFTQLPKLQPFVTYPFGLKIAEISLK